MEFWLVLRFWTFQQHSAVQHLVLLQTVFGRRHKACHREIITISVQDESISAWSKNEIGGSLDYDHFAVVV